MDIEGCFELMCYILRGTVEDNNVCEAVGYLHYIPASFHKETPANSIYLIVEPGT